MDFTEGECLILAILAETSPLDGADRHIAVLSPDRVAAIWADITGAVPKTPEAAEYASYHGTSRG